jgi:hypothetical protein
MKMTEHKVRVQRERELEVELGVGIDTREVVSQVETGVMTSRETMAEVETVAETGAVAVIEADIGAGAGLSSAVEILAAVARVAGLFVSGSRVSEELVPCSHWGEPHATASVRSMFGRIGAEAEVGGTGAGVAAKKKEVFGDTSRRIFF